VANDPSLRIEPVLDRLPAGFAALREAAHAEGHGFLEKLAIDWASGAMRFDRMGEILLAATLYSASVVHSASIGHNESVGHSRSAGHGELTGIGGLTIDPVVTNAMRMRRFYVSPRFRRGGIGATLARTLRDRALASGRAIALNASPESVPFWEALGFVPDPRDGHTHCLNMI
jgi:GNAT superfamily N-acetyltransferase